MKRPLLMLALILLLSGCDRPAPIADNPPAQKDPVEKGAEIVANAVQEDEPDHADREKVRQWLRENTPTGKWEEIKWWRAADRPVVSEDGKEFTRRMIRVKYRTANEMGGMTVIDEAYTVYEKDASLAPGSPGNYYRWWTED